MAPFPSLSLQGACLNNALRGGWTVSALGVDLIDLGYDADGVGAEDGADSRWGGGFGDSGWVAFCEGDSEKVGAGCI